MHTPHLSLHLLALNALLKHALHTVKLLLHLLPQLHLLQQHQSGEPCSASHHHCIMDCTDLRLRVLHHTIFLIVLGALRQVSFELVQLGFQAIPARA